MKVSRHAVAGWVTEPTKPNEYGASFRARLLRTNERYGREFSLTHLGGEPIIEWYDARYDDRFDYPGQFVSRYYITTLLASYPEVGSFGRHGEPIERGPLILDGGVPSWQVPETEVRAALLALLAVWRKGGE